MNITWIFTLVVLCLFDLTVAMRSRENPNVLVRENLQEKIKSLLNGDGVELEDFDDNDIESLREMENLKIEKLKKMRNDGKVFDDKNRNIELNQIEHELPLLDLIGNENDTETKWPSTFPTNNNETTNTSFNETEWPSTLPTNYNDTTSPRFNETDLTTSSPFHFVTESNATTPINSNHTTPVDSPTVFATTPSNATTIESFPETTPSNNASTNATTVTEPSWVSTDVGNTTLSSSSTAFENSTHPTDPAETSSSTTTEETIFDDLQSDECLLGKAERHLKWVDVEGKINFELLQNSGFENAVAADLSKKFIGYQEYEAFEKYNLTNASSDYSSLNFLSVAFNNLPRLPIKLLIKSRDSLEYLSLAGNNFSHEIRFDIGHDIGLVALKQLDLRRCSIKVLKTNGFERLSSLEYLYLSNNFISTIELNAFPNSLVHLDLSYNEDPSDATARLKLPHAVFRELSFLQVLDLSFTKVTAEAANAFKYLPRNLTRLSICNTELPKTTGTFIAGSTNIKYLDISKNLLELKSNMFVNFSDSLLVLFAREANVKTLDWTDPLHNLKFFDLFDNNIHRVTNTSFSHMTNLVKLNLEKNSIGNWYGRLFSQNQKLRILNLRENKLNLLTNDMILDLLSVEFLAMGQNEFECSCDLQKFMFGLFEATKHANSSEFPLNNEPDSIHEENNELNEIEGETPRPLLTLRTHMHPEYEVFARTYNKYYEMAERSVQALRSKALHNSGFSKRHLIAFSATVGKAAQGENSFQTILFDYDDDDNSYKCMNASLKVEQPIINSDLCEEDDSERPATLGWLAISWISFIGLFMTVAIILVVYWKWWYVKYFFVLCRNSAILTFMDYDSETEKIIKAKSEDSVDVFAYDVFVSYSDQNRHWVLDEFIPNIEKRESINVCLHERDFQVGNGILENIVSCMDRSRCLLLLISENFLLSQWCRFEMNLAQHRLLETRRDKLILVLLEDISVQKQPKTLKYLMRTKTYIKWPVEGSSHEKQLFWKRLKKAITSSKWENEAYGSYA